MLGVSDRPERRLHLQAAGEGRSAFGRVTGDAIPGPRQVLAAGNLIVRRGGRCPSYHEQSQRTATSRQASDLFHTRYPAWLADTAAVWL